MSADRDSAAPAVRAPRMRPVALALSGLFAAVALGMGGLWVAQQSLGPLSSPETLAAESVRALQAGEADVAKQAIARELEWGDRRASAWCRLAFAEFSRSRRFDDKVVAALTKSYEVASFDAEAFAWRIQFIFDHWTEVPEPLRRSAMREARGFHSDWSTRAAMEAVVPQVRDPTGQFALRLALRGAEPKSRS